MDMTGKGEVGNWLGLKGAGEMWIGHKRKRGVSGRWYMKQGEEAEGTDCDPLDREQTRCSKEMVHVRTAKVHWENLMGVR